MWLYESEVKRNAILIEKFIVCIYKMGQLIHLWLYDSEVKRNAVLEEKVVFSHI